MTLRSRGYLPHLESDNAIYFVTFRLAGTLPKSVLESYEFERDSLMKLARQQNRLTSYEQTTLKFLYSQKIQDYLDRSEGECWLRNKRIAQLMIDALKKFNEIRYLLHAWCVMPNHVHVVFHDFSSGSLSRIVHSWKSFTAHQANEILKRSGKFWHNEYYDHVIRWDEDFAHSVEYTLQNPVKAGFCDDWHDWPWNGCSEEVRRKLEE